MGPVSQVSRGCETERATPEEVIFPVSLPVEKIQQREEELEVSSLGGRLNFFAPHWERITNNPYIVDWVRGYRLPFINLPRPEDCSPVKGQSQSNPDLLQECIKELLEKGVIEKVPGRNCHFLSPFFLIERPNKQPRFILNLKKLNTFIKQVHFKMEDYRTALKLVQKGAFMCTIDLKDAYYAIPVHRSHRRFLAFRFQGAIYQYRTLPFGLSSAPYAFTKLTRPVVTWLRKAGVSCVIYLDDFLIIDRDAETCRKNTRLAVKFLESLGFIINYEKSELAPHTQRTYLGFIFNSRNMTLSLPQEKRERIFILLSELITLDSCSIRHLAKVIGLLVSVCPAIRYGWLYTKNLERFKTAALLQEGHNFNRVVEIPVELQPDILWWKGSILNSFNKIRSDSFDIEIFSDSSTSGWGAYSGSQSTHGWWSLEDQSEHIHFLELKSAFLALKCFASDLRSVDILLRVDNTTAISYINRMGSVKYPKLSFLARELWQWCERRDIWVQASYIPSACNSVADFESRILPSETEYELNNKIFRKIVRVFGEPQIDLFASYLNRKCTVYASFLPDPESYTVDAFTISWRDIYFYAFPPFCLILRVLNKIKKDQAEGIMVVPKWESQPWYPLWKNMLTDGPIVFHPVENPIIFPFSTLSPPACSLEVGRLSGKLCC